MKRLAFTLLETLLAISLTVSVGIAALSLTTLQARLGAAARTQEEALALVTETARLLDDDLLLAVKQGGHGRYQAQEQGGLLLVTTCRLPGESPGLHEVVWRFDPASASVVRTSTLVQGDEVKIRTVGRGWKQFTIVADHDALWLNARIGASAEAWSLPLWTEAP